MPNTKMHLRFWALALAGFCVAVWALSSILLPFVAGMVLAYFLDPAARALQSRGVPRWLGTLVVLCGFILLIGLLALLLVPLIQSQIEALIASLPSLVDDARARIMPFAEHWMASLSKSDVAKLREAAGSYAGQAVGFAGQLLQNIITEGAALFNILGLVIVTPVVAFYILRDWPKITQTIDALLPRNYYDSIHARLSEIDRALSGFIRGQALVCLSLGAIYATGLTIVGVKFGATVGLVAGALSFVPYVGSTFGLVVSMLLAIAQFDDALRIGATLGVFLLGQTLEGYVLTPKLVGDRIGLHPVWILFALFAGGSLLGFLGVFIAVPTAAIAGVLIRSAIARYRRSSLYQRAP